MEVSRHRKKMGGVCLWLLFTPGIILAQPLTEEKSIQLGLEQKNFTQLLDSQLEKAHGDILSARNWRNPEVELSRQEVGDETETEFWIYQQFDLSGKRRLVQQSSEARLLAAESSVSLQRLERIYEVRNNFYQALFHQQQQKLYEHWVDKFTDVELAMAKREAAGDVSGYDRRRISREQVGLLAKQREAGTAFEVTLTLLMGLIGQRTVKEVGGELIPDEQPTLETLLPNVGKHPLLLSLQKQSDASRLNADAVAKSRIPDLTLGLGQKSVDGPGGSDSGFMISASIPLPVFDRKQGERMKAWAHTRQLESEHQLALQQAKAELSALWYRADQLRENAQMFSEQSVATSYELVRIAETSYYASEIGVLELIDAYRSALDAEITATALAYEARLARIELDKMIDGVQ